jgi:excinuclease ABC subunit A
VSTIRLRGGRVHNLKNVDVDIPRGKLITVCGVSGSGKTSLALNTLYAEGQRAYIEGFSAYTRQFLERLDRPECISIEGIPPAIAVTRAGAPKTNRSTVATATEIADSMRLLFAKVAKLFCNECGKPVQRDDPSQIAEELTRERDTRRLMIGFNVCLPSRKEASEIFSALQQDGYLRLIIGDRSFHLSDDDRATLAKQISNKGTECTVIIDRLTGDSELSRVTESLETAMNEGHDRAIVLRQGGAGSRIRTIDGEAWNQRIVSVDRRCEACGIDYPDPQPRLFNFNHPLGACPTCEGFGDTVSLDMDLVVPDRSLSIRQGAIAPWNSPSYRHELEELLALADDYEIPVDVPFGKLDAKSLKRIERGVPERNFGGLDGFFAWLDRKKYKLHVRVFAARYRSYHRCTTCNGRRLRPEALAYRLGEQSIAECLALSADDALKQLTSLELTKRDAMIAHEPLKQVCDRLRYLQSVGLGYLQLDRTLRTLSGGEIQRVALTAALGSSLVNMLYVLDEPTAGLHPADVKPLVTAIDRLKERGNTVIMVEHDETLIRHSEWIVEVGPGAGAAGGQITFLGSPEELLVAPDSPTGQFLSGRRGWTLRDRTPRAPQGFLTLEGAQGHNLQNVHVEFPLGVLCLVTGVSGSGKSSLVQDTLYLAIAQRMHITADKPLPFRALNGLSRIQDCLMIDQSPISRSARSCPVTYVKAFDPIRKLFAETLDAKTRNYGAGHFSFNSSDGQCLACEGAGVMVMDMQFLADVTITCPSCRGFRYRDEILNIRYRDQTIADVLAMSIRTAYTFFRGQPKIQSRLKCLIDVGLDYVTLGQPATTLSSGEGQRLKLAAFLALASRKSTLFLLDEPTTGLHFSDIIRLVDCFDALIADGHSLIVIEHHPLLMQAADYLIDLGPGAAEAGGRVIAQGTPAQVAKVSESRTGEILREIRTQT